MCASPFQSHPERSGGLAQRSRRTSNSRRGRSRRSVGGMTEAPRNDADTSRGFRSSFVIPHSSFPPPAASAREKLEVLRLRSVPPSPARNSAQDDREGWAALSAQPSDFPERGGGEDERVEALGIPEFGEVAGKGSTGGKGRFQNLAAMRKTDSKLSKTPCLQSASHSPWRSP